MPSSLIIVISRAHLYSIFRLGQALFLTELKQQINICIFENMKGYGEWVRK